MMQFSPGLLVLILATASWAQGPIIQPPLAVTDNVVLSGVLSPQELIELEAADALVIDLRTAEEIAEAGVYRPPQLEYVNLPIGKEGLTSVTVNRFESLLDDTPDRQIRLHCASGNRAGMLWAAHLINQGMSRNEALATVSAVVTKDTAIAAIEEYARD